MSYTTYPETNLYFDNDRLQIVNDLAAYNMDELLDRLNVNLNRTNRMFVGTCPIHNGDNPTAFNLYFDGHTVKGYWKCRTHLCHKDFGSTMIGFVRGMLSSQNLGWTNTGDEKYSFQKSVDFICQLVGQPYLNIKVNSSDVEKRQFISQTYIQNGHVNGRPKILRNRIRSLLDIPADYFIKRGFSREILDKYDVGMCVNKKKEMYGRAVVPIYDENYEYMIGCTGRIPVDKCSKCCYYHHPSQSCPANRESRKWYNNFGFARKCCLYNYWFARKHVEESGEIIIVEGPGDVWRLVESNIHNCVAIFGCELSDEQQIILEKSGAMSVTLLLDNDSAGEEATIDIKKKLSRYYKLNIPQITSKDLGDMEKKEIELCLKKY